MTPTVEFAIYGIFFLWLSIITFFLWSAVSHYNHLTKGVTDKSLTASLDVLLKDADIAKRDIEKLVKRCDTIEQQGQLHIQKIGLLRFNPFKDTGGDQSFILSLLDGTDTGVVISGLYSRSGTRWYAKQVQQGNGVEHELSHEEQKAVKEARKIHG